ncbi:hypothetical protein [Nocardia carnea]|uniref:hypothetical protein n=1 Tax=Nocardia carnea TaxID=37328 RepID=UPI00245469DC|nr:hypothetical protein [Nocardia carnea]
MSQDVAQARPEWKSTGSTKFPLAARVDGCWWVLRMNPFPDHCMWTLFIDGVVRYDLEKTPPDWGRLGLGSAPLLDQVTTDRILAPLRGFTVYGSEAGRPCDDPFCCG